MDLKDYLKMATKRREENRRYKIKVQAKISRRMAKLGIIMPTMYLLLFLICGCNEEQKWGQGDPPAGYIESFGNENLPRLVYVLEQRIIKLQTIVHGINNKDKAGKITHQPGIIDYLALTDNRLKVLEDPNSLNELEQRIDCLEERADKAVYEYDELPQCQLIPKKGYTRWQIGKGFFGKGWFEVWNGTEWEKIDD